VGYRECTSGILFVAEAPETLLFARTRNSYCRAPEILLFDYSRDTVTLCYIEYVDVILYVISAINGIKLYYLG
jgi:hypothetical protein